MKTFILSFLFIFSVASHAEVIKTNTPLKSKEIYDVIYKSAEAFLAYEDQAIAGGLYGDLTNPTIVEIDKDNNGDVVQLKVQYEAFFFTTDFDFGDPVHEEYTTCLSTLDKSKEGRYTVELTKTTCDFNPQTDVNLYGDYNPCCDNGPVVDSNMCFDSYEEGAEVCGTN